MVTQQQFKDHYNKLYNSGAIYVWGANGEIITKDLTNRLYKNYGSSKYNKTYYDNKYKEGKGKIGADCSGSIYPLSKADNTAKGYYNECSKRGSINNLPANTACLIFNANFTHVGAYLGNGTTIEMMSSTRNCVKQSFNKSRWAYYGIPNWLETNVSVQQHPTSKPVKTMAKKKEVIKNIQRWCNDYCNAGLTENGIFGTKTKAACITASGKTPLVYICQAMLYCKGYNMSNSISNNKLDGIMGQGTKKQILLYQQNTRGLRHDGCCGAATFYAMFNS